MRDLISCIWVALICVFWGPLCSAEDSPGSPWVFKFQSHPTPHEVWEKLLACPTHLPPEHNSDGFVLESLSVDRSGVESRAVMDLRGDYLRELGLQDGDVGPYFDGPHGIIYSNRAYQEHQLPSENRSELITIGIPVRDLLQAADKDQPVEWSKRDRTYVRPVSQALTCRVSLRTPSDSELWNCSCQHVTIWTKGHSREELRRIVMGPQQEYRLTEAPGDWFGVWIAEQTGQPMVAQMESLFARVTHQEQIHRHTSWVAPQDVLFGQTDMYGWADNYEGHEAATHLQLRRVFLHIRKYTPVWMTRATAMNLSYVKDASLTMDDPAMRYWRAEMIMGPRRVAILEKFLRKFVLRTPSIPVDIRLQACDVLGDLGRPAILFEPLALIADRPLCEAILFSRWQYPLQDEHVEACVAALQGTELESKTRSFLVESLVRMDELPLVPAQALSNWWEQEVVAKSREVYFEYTDDPAAPNRDARFPHLEVWDTICITSRTPSGREFLRKRLDTNDPQFVKRAIFRCLRLRAESTVRTERWDFMTEAECETVLALSEPPTPGKETDGGAARPFPKDE